MAIKVSIIMFCLGTISLIFFQIIVSHVPPAIFDFSVLVSGGITTSGVSGFIIYSVEYCAIRKKSSIQFLREADKFVAQIKSINYCFFDAPLEQLIGIAQKEFDDQNFSNKEFDNEKKRIKKIIFKYCEISKYSLSSLMDSYEEVFFLFKKKGRNDNAQLVYETIRKYKKSIIEVAYHFNIYLEGESRNFAAVLIKLDEIQKIIFEIKEETVDNYFVTLAYDKAQYDINCLLEEFRHDVFGGQKRAVEKTASSYCMRQI